MSHNKYDWIKEQETNFAKPIALTDGWSWSFKDHVRLSFLYRNSQFSEDNDDRKNRPFKNIVRPILNVHYRTEGLDVKDIELYVNNPDIYWKSFLVKKFHEKWALENEIDTFIDDLVESYVDYGGVLVKNVDDVKPEVVDLLSLAFCDQTNLISGPFAIKHDFSPQELRDMADNGWGKEANGATIEIETLITLSEPKKNPQPYKTTTNFVPGKNIEIYEVHGTLPEHWLGKKKEYDEKSKYVPQIQIVAYYKNNEDQEVGVTLFASREPKLPFKFLARDKVWGRALGFGAVEELFEAQVWTNDNEVKMQEMLEIASKTFFKTTDQRFKTRNSLLNSENGKIFDLQTGTDINQLDTTPRNLVVFNNAVREWQDHAQLIGAASEPLQGEAPPSGTPFKLQELVTSEAKGLHRWRQGKIAVFMDEVYREWILPHIAGEISKDNTFLATLSVDELQEVTDRLVDNEANRMVKDRILNGELVSQEEIDTLKEKTRIASLKSNKKFIKILKDEFKKEKLEVMTNIAGKQRNLTALTDKMVNLVRQVISTPQILQDPYMTKLLNQILESSGLSPIMFGSTRTLALPAKGGTEALQDLAKGQKEEATVALK